MNRKIRRTFSIILVACMLLSLVPLHATSLNGEEDSISNELVVDEELSPDSNAEESSTESTLLSEQEISSSTVSNNDVEEIKTSDETESYLSSDSEEEIAEQQDILTMADEETEEPENDNWELGLVFYDSSVDNGKTPLTEINWDASDGGYGEGISRVITVQINYKNTNAVTTYQPGELEISIPNLIYNTSSNTDASPYWKSSVIVGANDSTHNGYDWNFTTGTRPTYSQKTYNFKNSYVIEEESNFEGSIQIQYTIIPDRESGTSNGIWYYPESFDDDCVHQYSKILQAELKNISFSNEINFDYIRTYNHPWKYKDYTVTKTASKISSYDGLGESADSYIWVKYGFYHSNLFATNFTNSQSTFPYSEVYPYIYAKNGFYKDKIPEECKVYDNSGVQLSPDENGYYTINASSSSGNNYTNYIYVGYPKETYNEESGNLNITNEVELWGTYNNKTESEKLNKAKCSLNLANFNFAYSGNLYGVEKKYNGSSSSLYTNYYDSLVGMNTDIGGKGKFSWQISPTVRYTGKPITLMIGDDLLYITRKNGNYSKLEDDEYYFTSISFPTIYNGNNIAIEKGKYNCKLYVRRSENPEYILYEEFKNNPKTYNFTKEDNIVAYYFTIENMEESVSTSTKFNNTLLINNAKDISESGTVYNFSYLKVYIDDILQNEPQITSYNSFITKEEIAAFDIETYGTYLQRSCANYSYSRYVPPDFENMMQIDKTMSSFAQDNINECFTGSATLSMKISPENVDEKTFTMYYKDSEMIPWIEGYELFELLPEGMELVSTIDSIKKSAVLYNGGMVYDRNYEKMNQDDFKRLVLDNLSVETIDNYNGTNRTYIHILIDLEDNPFVFINGYGSFVSFFSISYKYKVSYDSFLEYGSVWNCPLYAKFYNKIANEDKKGFDKGYWFGRGWPTIRDNGINDKDIVDIDNNGNIDELLAYKTAQATISSVISTHQDVTKYVKTDKSAYSTGKVESSYDSEYEYKLRVRTGQNDVTNLVIYDSIEEYAQDKNGNIVPAYGTQKHWNGEFLGVDTSYAESKGYKVKVYYSEDEKAGNLDSDDSWKEYDDTVDKSKVKSLAFEYLNAEGNPAKLPANSLTYVLIKMKSPADENITSLAYNGCRTQWQALDDYGRPVDFITGINSNIVKVSLPNSVEDKEVNLSFNKIMDATNEDFEKLKLDKEETYNFFISLTNQETGEVINGLLDSKEGFRVNNIPTGTYIIEEQNDIWFSFVSMTLIEPIEGIDFKEENGTYIISIGASVESGATAEIEVTNKPDEERFYNNKYDIKNLFNFEM